MVDDHTFHLHHSSLVVGLFIIHGCINPWHDPSHIINYGRFLDVVDSPIVLLFMWAIPQHIFFSTTPTFQGFSLWVINLSWGRSRRFISALGGEIMLVYTSGWEDHPWVLFTVFKSWGFEPLFLKSRTILLFPTFARFCLMPKLFITISCLSDSVF